MTTFAAKPHAVVPSPFDPHALRANFPILSAKTSSGKPLVYLDNGATTQKPQAVIDAIVRYYTHDNANIHRGVYELSQRATEQFESARRTVRRFLNAADAREIIFTRGTTEGINLVAHGFARALLQPGDEVLISALEHHSNIVPWQMACEAAGAKLRVLPINGLGEIDLAYLPAVLSSKTKLVAVNHVSNSLGSINPVEELIAAAHATGAKVLIDGAQWVAHGPTDVQALDVDFYVFSAHKLYGPTGIGVLYGKRELLEAMPPYQGGGDMIRTVTFEHTEYADLPNKFEAGTPDISGAIALAAAIDYVQSIGFDTIAKHEAGLLRYATERLARVPGLRVIGTADKKGAVVSFVLEKPAVSSLDIGTKLDAMGIAVRTGHHCCQPVMDRFGIPGTTRASFAVYNTYAEVDALVDGLMKITAAEQQSVGSPPAPPAVAAVYPAASASTIAAAADALADLFEFLGDRDARNQELLSIGEKLPPMPAAFKTDATRVHGCMSVVHLHGHRREGTDRLDFLADADAHIVRGLIGVLVKLFAGQRAADILAFDVEAFFARIGLEQFVSTQRRNGLAGMVQRIRRLAKAIADQQPQAPSC